ncbi:hypothetical protein H2248_007075 [Termitomyces sp. 'cryptogamus']|nr:hypothetical protein H2248_007075 [Termitomyces sp. 'cryptogamus']
MNLATLLGGNKAVDTELDALFTVKPVASKPIGQVTPIPISDSSKDTTKKRKSISDLTDTPESKKRAKTNPSNNQASEKALKDKKAKGGKNTKGQAKQVEPAEDEDENSDLEKAYLDTHKPLNDLDAPDSDASGGGAERRIEHETVTKAKKASRSGPKVKYVPADETSELRDQRTIFVGNIAVDVAQKKPLLRQLHRHILSQIPTAKIESTRFRSVPFQAPTSKLPDDDTLKGKADPKNASTAPKSARQRDIDRTSTWRLSQKDKDEEGPSDEKKYLNPSQKKKIAFINHEFHSEADTVNAYIVFAHPVPAENRPKNLPPPPPVLDPYEAARQAVRACDGSTFMDRVIRVDLVGRKVLPKLDEEADVDIVGADPKSTVFVGNLDFASKEEDLRAFFEGIVTSERGTPPAGERDTEAGGIKKANSWVVRVRIVRDKDTQLGKGFAYVQFIDHACVDEVVALEPIKLKFAKRKLRVQRCRTLPGSSVSTRQVTASKPKDKATSNASTAAKRSTPIVVPKGDPSLGEKLAHLSKDARKQYKSSDADRVARRLAKKKARMGMSGIKIQGKEKVRERVRKGAGEAAKKKINTGTKKGRVRSEKSLMRRNGKKGGTSG